MYVYIACGCLQCDSVLQSEYIKVQKQGRDGNMQVGYTITPPKISSNFWRENLL